MLFKKAAIAAIITCSIVFLLICSIGTRNTLAQFNYYDFNIGYNAGWSSGNSGTSGWGIFGGSGWGDFGNANRVSLNNTSWGGFNTGWGGSGGNIWGGGFNSGSLTYGGTLRGFSTGWGGFGGNTWGGGFNSGSLTYGGNTWSGFNTGRSGQSTNTWGNFAGNTWGGGFNSGSLIYGGNIWSGFNTGSGGSVTVGSGGSSGSGSSSGSSGSGSSSGSGGSITSTNDGYTLNDPMVKKVHQLINAHRASIGLSSLAYNETIAQQAKEHSNNMASGAVEFSHQGFQQRINEIGKVIHWTRASENVAYNMGYSDPADMVVQSWLDSPGHRENIEGNYNLTGIGISKNQSDYYYFTQIFILTP